MLIGTHALSPVVTGFLGSKLLHRPLSGRELILIACIGAAPDLLNPHVTLADRHASWSHSLVGFLIIIGTFSILTIIFKKLRTRCLAWAAFAYLWHLVCDWFAGGIPYLYPIKTDIIGHPWLPPSVWLYFDAFFILCTYVIWSFNRKSRKPPIHKES